MNFNDPMAIQNEMKHPNINMPMAVQSEMDHYNEENSMTQENEDIFNMTKENESDIDHLEEDTSFEVQDQIINSKNKGGRPKKWRRKMPLTLRRQEERKTKQIKTSYLKHRQG